MVYEILPVGMLQCNCVIFGDEATGEAIVIDPGDDIDQITALLDKHSLKVSTILITHAHIDHIGGAAKLKKLTGAPVHMNERDRVLYVGLAMQAAWLGIPCPDRTEIDVSPKDGDRIHLAGTEMEIILTPGHTQGSLSLWLPSEKAVVAGDTLFRDSIGRTDLPGGDGKQILRSIHNKLLVLPEDAIVIPGHGDLTTIGREKLENPFLN